jgi:hypothetical protein
MSIEPTSPQVSTELSPDILEERDVELDRVQGIHHGEYQQAHGTIGVPGVDRYDVTVTEKDDTYHLQVRNSEGKRVIDTYVASENPYEELPESDQELYEMVSEV